MNRFTQLPCQVADANVSVSSARPWFKTSVITSVVLSATLLSACGSSGSSSTPDTTAPVVTLTGASALTQAYGEAYVELGASAQDDIDGDVAVVISGDVDVNTISEYTVTYEATDAAGNVASTQRTVMVVDDVAPIITLEGEASIELGQGRDYIERGATAEDNVDGELTVTNIIGGDFDTTVLGTYQVTYQISDGAGNESETVTRSIEVVEPRPFIFTYQTTEDNEDFTPKLAHAFITPADYTYDYSIDWGDDSIDENVSGELTHTYAEAGVYTVSINGTLPMFRTDDSHAENYRSIEQWGDIKWLFADSFFGNAVNLVGNATDTPDLRLVTSLQYMFGNAHNFNSDISQWQVGHIISFETMFITARAFDQDISAWDMSSAEIITDMFRGANAFNQDLSAWDTSSVQSFRGVFRSAPAFDQDLSAWDMSTATRMTWMFENSQLSSSNYDKLLNSLAAQAVNDDVDFHGGFSVPTEASADAVAVLEAKGWEIIYNDPE